MEETIAGGGVAAGDDINVGGGQVAGRDFSTVNLTVNVADLDRQMHDLSEELKARTPDGDYARILNDQFMIVWGALAESLKQNAGIQGDVQNLERTVGRMVDAVYGNGSVGLLRGVDRLWRMVWMLAGSAITQWLFIAGLLVFQLALARYTGF